jgi:hypothetical protein
LFAVAGCYSQTDYFDADTVIVWTIELHFMVMLAKVQGVEVGKPTTPSTTASPSIL